MAFARWKLLLGLALLVAAGQAQAGQTQVAVAANFTAPAKEIAALFRARTGDEAALSFGASGTFYAQIEQGAPFQVFLSADAERPRAAIEAGLAVAGSRFTYAVGKLALWSRTLDVSQGDAALKANAFTKLAIADPKSAPYGAAAVETMKALGVYEAIAPKIVQGENIAQAFQFVDTDNAELGFVALSQLARVTAGSRWLPPQSLYSPIRQDAVLLKSGGGDEASIAFLAFLKSAEARAVIARYGYAAE